MRRLVLVLAIVMITTVVFSQPRPNQDSSGGAVGGGAIGEKPEAAPIDGGLSILLVAGVGYAIMRKKKTCGESVCQIQL